MPKRTKTRDAIISAIKVVTVSKPLPVLVAIDVGSGAGKSTLGSMVAEELRAALVHGDDFYASDIPDVEWDGMSLATITYGGCRSSASGTNSRVIQVRFQAGPARWHLPTPRRSYVL